MNNFGVDSMSLSFLYKENYHEAAELMDSRGGSFAKQIAGAFFHADPQNTVKLVDAFRELFDQYFNDAKELKK